MTLKEQRWENAGVGLGMESNLLKPGLWAWLHNCQRLLNLEPCAHTRGSELSWGQCSSLEPQVLSFQLLVLVLLRTKRVWISHRIRLLYNTAMGGTSKSVCLLVSLTLLQRQQTHPIRRVCLGLASLQGLSHGDTGEESISVDPFLCTLRQTGCPVPHQQQLQR